MKKLLTIISISISFECFMSGAIAQQIPQSDSTSIKNFMSNEERLDTIQLNLRAFAKQNIKANGFQIAGLGMTLAGSIYLAAVGRELSYDNNGNSNYVYGTSSYPGWILLAGGVGFSFGSWAMRAKSFDYVKRASKRYE